VSAGVPATDRTVLVTGATDGLGRALSQEFARRGWTVLAHGRDEVRGSQLVAELKRLGAPQVRFYKADFASLAEVGAMARRVLREEPVLHVLVNNAGIGILPRRELSRDGHELVFQVNYLSGYLLSRALSPLLIRSAPARIINVSSAGQYAIDFSDLMLTRRWHGLIAYGRSKLAQILMTFTLARELEPEGVMVNAVHPATLMATKMTSSLGVLQPKGLIGRLLMWRLKARSTTAQGAKNITRLIDDPKLGLVTGCFFKENREKRAHKQAYDYVAQATLEAISQALCQNELVACK
jgi:NAD(P)-dependent dehydrogenase (short-subunit alcohol dehydrogenase family)